MQRSIPAHVFLYLSLAFTLRGQTYPFTVLNPGYTQELFGAANVPNGIIGGMAFAPDGDVWAKICDQTNTPLRFDLGRSVTVNGTSVHPLATVAPVAPASGCGISNHSDGRLYTNTPAGLQQLDANTGAVLTTVGQPGNTYGITIDPRTGRLVYPAATCAASTTCKLLSLDPLTADTQTLATFTSSVNFETVDGIVFDPTGAYIVVAGRTGVFPMDPPFLTVLTRTGTLVRALAADHYPDGVAFHKNPFYLVANNNDGTINRYDFPADDLRQPPVVTEIATGGFRGDLTAVGPDGCFYVSQQGARYASGATTTENSVVRLCTTAGAFVQPGLAPRTISHIANGASFRTTIALVNTGTQPANFAIKFLSDPGTPLTLPLGADGTVSALSGVIQPGVTRFIQTTGDGVDLQKGWAELTAPDTVDGNSIFGSQSAAGESEAAVPLSPAGGAQLYLPFDNSPGYVTGVALADPEPLAANVSATFIDDSGQPIPDTHTISVPSRGHYSDVLASPFPLTQGKRGVAHFSSNANIFGLGIRANGRAFTSIDALSGVTSAAKTIAHIADGGGWRMTFLLVNTGTTPANFTLKFWDDNGFALLMPLGPDGGGSTVSGSIQPGALRVIQTTGSSAQLATGWAELTSTGPIGGTAIFGLQTTGQSDSEAAAPFTLAGSTQLFMPYDYTAGHSTGMAITNPNPNQSATVTASFINDNGQILASGRVVMVPPHGHVSKVLSDLFSGIFGSRGTISLTSDVPIVGLGIRANGLAFTSLKVIAK